MCVCAYLRIRNGIILRVCNMLWWQMRQSAEQMNRNHLKRKRTRRINVLSIFIKGIARRNQVVYISIIKVLYMLSAVSTITPKTRAQKFRVWTGKEVSLRLWTQPQKHWAKVFSPWESWENTERAVSHLIRNRSNSVCRLLLTNFFYSLCLYFVQSCLVWITQSSS